MTSTIDVAPEADRLVREAHEASYRFPPDFTGFTAAIRVRAEGLEAHGRVTFRAGERPEVKIELPEHEASWLAHELGSLAGHRFHRSYDDADGRNPKTLAADDGNPLGRLVEIEDAMDSSYRIDDGGMISEITRTHGGSRFTIVIQQRLGAPDGRFVSAAFTVSHWDEVSGSLRRSDAYSDSHLGVGDVLLPGTRRVATASEGGLVVREIELSGHELLEEDA